jgi:hypothetical protein
MATEKCRSCGAPVVWCKTADGKRMPVDAGPTPDGNLIVFAASGEVRSVAAADRPTFAGQLHKSHFASCPQAGKWRKEK